jgi:predicted ATPase/DNA-binding SARP family transcriptional activator
VDTDGLWQIQLFGTLTLTRREQVVTRFRTRRAGALVGLLALRQALSRDEVSRAIWPDATLEVGRARLRQELAALRRQIEEPGRTLFLADRATLQLQPGAFITDVARFDALLTRGRDETDLARLQEAAALYRGPLLHTLDDDWVLPERERLFHRQAATLALLAEREHQAGRVEAAQAWARKAHEHDPLGEAALLRLLRLLSPRDARRVYEAFVARLKKERGEAPSEFVQSAGRALDRPRAAPPAPPVAPPLTPVPAPELTRLPAALTRFFGREDELRWLERTWSEGARLVTLTGPGGAGKTRLAIEAGRREPGALFATLVSVTEIGRVADRIVEALGLPPLPHLDPLERAIRALQEKDAPLLILDNCEQAVDGAAETARALLESVTGLRVLATSRQALLIHGERELPLPPLPTEASVQLFVDRARAVRRDFALTEKNAPLIDDLCRRLDGVPLGLELAASRMGVFSVGQLLEHVNASLDALQSRARDLPERHRSLRAAIEGSVRDLTDESRLFFARLSLFRGGWSREAAEAIDPSALEHLETLRTRSLLSVAEDESGLRWSMLETLRDYAQGTLSPEALQSEQRRHGEWFIAYAQRSADAPDALERERDNLRAAAAWAINHDPALALTLASVLRDFFHVRGPLSEGRALADAALKAGRDAPAELRASACHTAGFLARLAGDFPDARFRQEQALALYRSLSDRTGIATALNNLGVVARVTGDLSVARRHYAEALTLRKQLGEPRAICASLNNLGIVARASGELETARFLLLEGLTLARTLQQPTAEGAPLINLGWTETEAGELAAARRYFAQALEIYIPLGSRVALVEIAEGGGCLLGSEGATSDAARLWGGAARLREELGAPLTPADRDALSPRYESARATGPETFEAAWQEGRQLSFETWLALLQTAISER